MHCPEGGHTPAFPNFLLGQLEWGKAPCRELARSSCCTNQGFVSLNLFCFDAKLETLSPPRTLPWSSLELFSAWTSDSPAGREGRYMGPTSLTPHQDAGGTVFGSRWDCFPGPTPIEPDLGQL